MAIENKKWIELPREKLVKAPWNYKEDDEWKAEKLTANIKRNGQVVNMIVRPKGRKGRYEVVNGNHRLDSFDELGFKTIVCFNTGKISLAAAKRLAVETNETSFDPDSEKLDAIVRDLVTEFPIEELEVTMPYTEDELEQMAKIPDLEPPPGTGGGTGDKGGKPLTCPECGYKFPNKR
jgi:hypothetical protein